MTALVRATALPRERPALRFGVRAQLVAWVLVAATVCSYLLAGPTGAGRRDLVGNLTLLAALLYGLVCCIPVARRPAPGRRAWVLISVAMALGALSQVLFAAAVLRGGSPQPSLFVVALGYLGYTVPLLVALFLFPRPPERLISRFRGAVDAVVITTGVLLVSQATVGTAGPGPDVSTPSGLAALAYPVADVAMCAIVLTLAMRQAPADRLVWICMGTGLLSLGITDSVYGRLLAEGVLDATGTPLVIGWVVPPVLLGLAAQTAGRPRGGRRWDLSLVSQLLPYLPVVAAVVVLSWGTVEANPVLMAGAVLLLATVAGRQVMIVYENLTLTRDLERIVADRTTELETLGSILMSSREAIVGWSLEGTSVAWNAAAEQLFGYRAADVNGRGVDCLPEQVAQSVRDLLQSAARGEPLETYEWDWARPDGSSVPVSFTVSPVFRGGAVSGISVSAHDITERRRQAEVLEQAREDALQSARIKSEFLATMSHEIRTPMNGVIGLVSLLVDTDLDVQQREYAEGVQHAGQALLDVINDVLDFSKLEAGKLVLDAVDLDLRTLVEEVGDLLAPAANAKGLELLVAIDPATARVVRGDHGRIRQVLLNLGSNAVKFTAQGEVQIRVSSAAVDDGLVLVHVEVVDTGIGIADTDQPRVFDSFAQADASTTRRYGGSGLGLAISRRIVEVMDGEIGVRSVTGVGSTFWFDLRLPVVEPSTRAEPELPALGLLPARLRALVVDDNATNRTILTAQLGSWGIAVDVVDSAAHALAALASARPAGRGYDLALLDMLMPDVDGLELARRVNDDPDLTGLPMIMLSSAPRLAELVLEEVGVRRWLTKPVRAAALYDSIVRLVADTSRCPLEVAAAQSRRAAARSTTVRGRVLVVEDNELNQLVARGMVERLGFETDVAGNGAEALRALGRQTYDVVLMDCHMPVMDGFAATTRIREAERGRRRTPVVALTASALAADRERCLGAGMDDHVAKPIDPAVLSAALERWTAPGPGADGVPARGGPELSVVRDDHRLDPAQIQDLSELRTPDGASLLATFISSFTRRADSRLETIRSCANRADDEGLAMAAHELRGSAATIGAVRVAALCAELEHGGSAVLTLQPRVLDDLATELALAVAELDVIAGQAA